MARMVLQDGELYEEVVTLEKRELAQLDIECEDRERAATESLEALGNVDPEDSATLRQAAIVHQEAKAAFEDAKSKSDMGHELVGESANDGNDDGGADTDDTSSVPVDVTVANSEAEFQS